MKKTLTDRLVCTSESEKTTSKSEKTTSKSEKTTSKSENSISKSENSTSESEKVLKVGNDLNEQVLEHQYLG